MDQNNLDSPLSDPDEQIASSVEPEEVLDETASSGQLDGADGSEFAEEELEAFESEASLEAESENAVEGDSYLDDDEEWAASSDRILHQDEESVIAQQEEAVVSWDIRGLYDDQGKVRSKRSLRNNPPLLVISNSSGENASFVLTKDLSGVLSRHFDNTYRAYYGIRPKDEMSFKEKLSDAKTGLRENMGKAIIIGGILLGLLIFGFFF